MQRRHAGICACALGWSAITGCAVVNPRPDFDRVNQAVSAGVGVSTVAPSDGEADVRILVDERLEGGLTAIEALEICLLNNPRVRAAYSRVGVARADVVQASLFKNPALSLALRLPDGGGLGNVQTDLVQNIAEIWLIPSRVRAAERNLHRETLDVAREISIAALETRAAYYTVLAADREHELAKESQSVAQKLVDAALARQTAGVGSEIDVNLSRAECMQAEIAAKTARLAAFEARRHLLVLLGLLQKPEDVRLCDNLPEAASFAPDGEQLVMAAQRSRLDLVAADFQVEAAAARVELEKRSVISNFEMGVSFERAERGRRGDRTWLADTAWATAEAGSLAPASLRPREKLATDTVLGPALSLELPIFDQNQARIARAEYLHQSAVATRAALNLDVAQQTRAALMRAQTAWEISRHYRDQLLPLVEKNLDLGREAYRAGKLSLLAVLEAQKSLLTARSKHVEALRNGATAVTDLENAVGLPFDRIMQMSAAPAVPAAPAPSIPEVQP